MRAATGEARAINDIRRAILNRLKQARIILGIVLQVGVLHDHDVARRVTDRGLYCCALALIFRLKENFDSIQWIIGPTSFFLHPSQYLSAPILGAVVDQNNFLRQLDSAYTAHDFLQCALFVINGDQDGELHCSNSRFFSSRTNAESLGSALTASLILAWKSAAARSNGLVSTRNPSHWLSRSNSARVPRGFGETER